MYIVMKYVRKKARAPRRKYRIRRRPRKNFKKGHYAKQGTTGNLILVDKTRVGPMPQKYCHSFTYYDNALTINPAAGTIATYVYRLNSLYDPNLTGAGHQPNGFDQMMALYHYYNVVGAKCTFTIRNKDTTYSMYVGGFIHQSSTPTLILPDVLEQGNGSYVLLSPSGLNGDKQSLTVKWSARKWFGTKKLIGEDSYQALKTDNPTNVAYLVIWAAGRNGEDVQFAELDVRLDQIAVLTEPEYLNAS